MAMTLITTNTSSNAASSSFTSSIDSTYKLYIFKFYDVNPATSATDFSFQVNAAAGSGFNETMTTTYFQSFHNEDDDETGVEYQSGRDLAQGTGYQKLANHIGNASDESCAGELFLFNPSNTTYVKHFYATVNGYYNDGTDSYTQNNFIAGYINTTSAIDEVDFKFSSGNMDAVIKMYGVG
jgi:hypothetical protein